MDDLTKEQLLNIIAAADEVLTALAGTNEDIHRDDDAKMCAAWDNLNDVSAPPEVVKQLAQIALAALTADPLAYYWFNENDYGRDVSLTSPEEDDDAVDALENGWQVEPLIRIPKLTGGDEC